MSTILITAACGTNATGITPPVLPHDPVDEGWKAVENYEHAYNTKDADLLAVTLDSEFLHHLLEGDWGDYNGDGIIDSTWGYDMELSMAEGYFSEYEYCELNLEGDDHYTWPDDPSGESLAYQRSYYFKVYNKDPYQGFIEAGEFLLVCKPDSTGTWRLTHLIDQDIL